MFDSNTYSNINISQRNGTDSITFMRRSCQWQDFNGLYQPAALWVPIRQGGHFQTETESTKVHFYGTTGGYRCSSIY
jgi:hypothetical protein